MPIVLSCSRCSFSAQIPDTYVLRRVRCPRCGAAVSPSEDASGEPQDLPSELVLPVGAPGESDTRPIDLNACPFCGASVPAGVPACAKCGAVVRGATTPVTQMLSYERDLLFARHLSLGAFLVGIAGLFFPPFAPLAILRALRARRCLSALGRPTPAWVWLGMLLALAGLGWLSFALWYCFAGGA